MTHRPSLLAPKDSSHQKGPPRTPNRVVVQNGSQTRLSRKCSPSRVNSQIIHPPNVLAISALPRGLTRLKKTHTYTNCKICLRKMLPPHESTLPNVVTFQSCFPKINFPPEGALKITRTSKAYTPIRMTIQNHSGV